MEGQSSYFFEDQPEVLQFIEQCNAEGFAQSDECTSYGVDEWPRDTCEADIVSLEEIPPERQLRLRVLLPGGEGRAKSKLICYDALVLKQIVYVAEQEGRRPRLPDSNLPLTDGQIAHIKKHPTSLDPDFVRRYGQEAKRRDDEYLAALADVPDVKRPVPRGAAAARGPPAIRGPAPLRDARGPPFAQIFQAARDRVAARAAVAGAIRMAEQKIPGPYRPCILPPCRPGYSARRMRSGPHAGQSCCKRLSPVARAIMAARGRLPNEQ